MLRESERLNPYNVSTKVYGWYLDLESLLLITWTRIPKAQVSCFGGVLSTSKHTFSNHN